MPLITVGVAWAFVGAEGLHQVHVWLRSRHVQSRVVQGRHLGLIFPLGGTGANSRPGLTNDHEEDSDDDLQEQRDADESDEGSIVLGGRPLLQHRFQPHGIGHEESHVQHALCHALLGGIMVQVDGLAPPRVGVLRL